jgi:hypothetical protein
MSSTVTLTQGANAVNVIGTVVYGTDFYDDRLNQSELKTADGTDVVYDGGPTVCHGVLVFKGVSYTSGENLRTWLRTYAIWAYNTFTISALADADFGNGKNTAVTTARYDGGQSLKGVFDLQAPGQYNIKLPYRFIRS